MAQSMDDIQPDLNKAPPHVEGELLKENVKTTFGRRGWRKYFFVVRGDKLQYFRKKDEYETNKEPITYVKMSQVVEITEAVYSGVPKKHHLNCGFSVVSYHPHTQEEQTFHLLAETPEDMRYWVHGLRYIKAYWSKMMVRDTVLSEEQERKLLDRILNEEDYERGDEVYGDYTIGEGGQSDETTSRQVAVHFANGSKVKVTLSTTETTSDLLEMSEIKEQLSSSSAYIVRVDEVGKDVILETQDHPALYHSKSSTLYAVEHSHRLLVVYIDNQKDFECIYVSPHATDTEIIQHREISVKLDMTGVGNRGLFLKLRDSEQPFGLGESPCDVLFEMNINGELRRLPVGHLVVKNKALGGGRSTSRITRRWINRSTTHRPVRSVSDEGKKLEEISEEEDAQAMALDNFFNRMGGARVELDSTTELEIDGMVYVLPPDFNKDSKRLSSGSVNSDRSDESKHDEDHGLEDLTSPSSSRPHSGSMGGLRRSRLRPGDKFSNSSPSGSPATSPPRSRSKSPGRRLPDLPAKDSSVPKMSPSQQKKSQTLDKDFKGSPGALKRRGATRAGSLRSSNLSEGGHGYHNQPRGSWTEGVSKKNEDPPEVKVGMAAAKMGMVEPAESEEKVGTSPLSLHKRGPTIILSNEKGGVVGDARTDRPTLTTRPRSPSNRGSMVFDNLNLGDSRSSSFGRSQSPAGDNLLSSLPASIERQEVTIPNVSLSLTSSFGTAAAPSVDDEARLEHLFSRSFQQEQEEKSSHITKQVDTLSAKVKAVTEGSKEQKNVPRESPNVSPSHQFTPMLIDFAALQAPPTSPSETAPSKPTASTINVTSPSFLKVILLQSSTVADATEETKPMDFINLSGVCLRNERGAWQIQDGYNYHDPLPFDCTDHTETFPLPGGIRVVYNHTHKRWHVYPPPPISSAPSVDEDRSMADSTEHAQPKEEVDSRESSTEVSLYLTKKLIVTEIGTAFHHVMEQFEVSRDQAGKKKIGSDMVNVAMGHLIRGEFCTAIAKLLLDGMKPYRLEGLIQDDVWKVTVAFSNEAQSNPSLVYPSFDKLVFQPINSLKTLMKDYNIKYRTFVCLAMSRGMLTGFLEALPKQNNTLKKFYYPNAFLRLAADYQPYQALYQQILVTLEPMVHLPFDLSIDFESRQALERAKSVEVGVGDGVSETSSVSDHSNSSTPVRPIVVVKTHAATGQRTTAGNVKSVVWDTSPLHGSARDQATIEETDDGHLTTVTALKQLQEKHNQRSPTRTPFTELHPPTQAPPSSRQRTTIIKKNQQGPWWKKISDSFLELNKGGAITGPPKQLKQQSPKPPPPPESNERKVKALYNNIGDDADELTFNKDDILVVKEQINEEWLICTTGNRSGIVPFSYVQAV